MVRDRGFESLQGLREFSCHRISLGNTERFFISIKMAVCKLLRLHEDFVSSIVISEVDNCDKIRGDLCGDLAA
jgi:hypothetical protein